MRTLRQYRKVRGPDFHQPATRQNQGKLENGDGIEKVRCGFSVDNTSRASRTLGYVLLMCSTWVTLTTSIPLYRRFHV